MNDGDNVELTSSSYSFHFETLVHKLATCPYTHFHTSSTCSVVCGTSSDTLFLDPGKVTQQARKGYGKAYPPYTVLECQAKIRNLLRSLFLNTAGEPIKTLSQSDLLTLTLSK